MLPLLGLWSKNVVLVYWSIFFWSTSPCLHLGVSIHTCRCRGHHLVVFEGDSVIYDAILATLCDATPMQLHVHSLVQVESNPISFVIRMHQFKSRLSVLLLVSVTCVARLICIDYCIQLIPLCALNSKCLVLCLQNVGIHKVSF